jgi:hypothetical protein
LHSQFFPGQYIAGHYQCFAFGGGILILVINSYRKFLLSRLILTFLGSLLFMVGAISSGMALNIT